MYFCYVDEAGCTGTLSSVSSPIQPVFVICGVIVAEARIADLTLDFLHVKRRFYPAVEKASKHFLDSVLVEVKGGDLRKRAASERRRQWRHAIGFLDHCLRILEDHEARLVGRVWIKDIGRSNDGRAIYTFSVQKICENLQRFLEEKDAPGLVIADSRRQGQNEQVAHSIFTKKFANAGDAFEHIREMPTFGHSQNHVGLQFADLMASAFIFPIAIHRYCLGRVGNVHVRAGYERLSTKFSKRLHRLMYRYRRCDGWDGGFTVSDPLGQRPSSHLLAG